ncbi:Ribonuclease J 2 [bacterium HR33]|nr:Ribonuclease J 2 [bacterium HR33]
MLRVTVYGGVAGEGKEGEIGGNQILVEWEERAYLLDFGTRFAIASKYFEEFLTPRTVLGLKDFLHMGLIPPIEGIYREDLAAHDPELWQRYRKRPGYRRLEHLDGVLLSHAHVDHNGAIGFLKQEVPVYTGLMTSIIGKGLQDTKSGGPQSEFCYIQPREPNAEGVLEAIRGVTLGRWHVVCEYWEGIEKALEALEEFWHMSPSTSKTLEQQPLVLKELRDIGIQFYRVDHSIPGSGAFALETPIGWVVYTGDLRRHGHSKWRTERFAEAVAELKPELLIVEGTRLDQNHSTEETEVHQAAEEVVRAEKGLVIADFSPRNIERLRTFHDIARAVGRRLVVTTKDAYLLAQMHLIDPNIPSPDQETIAILKEPAARRQGWERYVFNRFSDNLLEAPSIRRSPGDYLLCLSFFDITNLIDLEPRGGTYIYSSSEAYNEEQEWDLERLKNWLDHFDLKPVGGLPGAERGPYHASGHIDGPGMQWLIETVNPRKILPVHTQKLGWFLERWPDRVISAKYAEPVILD